MQITITGPRGCGATSVTVEIARLLKGMGHEVNFMTRDLRSRKWREDMLSQTEPQKDWQPMKIVIVDGIEPEDERTVLERANKSS